jgi:anaerobic magnesium-protoporphyrin IX monomethyl ester cyclase
MRVLLIYPLAQYRQVPPPGWTPLGLSFIASTLQVEGHEVRIFDRVGQIAKCGLNKAAINRAMLDCIREFKPHLIGFNTISPLIYDTVECVHLIRRSYQGILLAGGHHATALPELTLKKIPGLDGVVQGEGEIVVLRFLRGESPERIPGFWWRSGQDHVSGASPQPIADLDALPFPALDLLNMSSYYARASVVPIRRRYLSTVSLLTSRGCTQKCAFCTEALTYGPGVRFHSPEYVLEWVKRVVRDFGVEGIYFHDNDFLISSKRAVQICEGFMAIGLHRKLKWAIQTRADRLTPEIAGLLKRAGCICIEIGIEAASQKELDAVCKMTTVSVNERAIAICRSMDLSVHAYMLTVLEGETIGDLASRLEWVKKVGPTSFSWHPIQIHPGSPLYLRKGISFFEKEDWTEENIISHYRGDHLSPIPAVQRDAWMKEHYEPFRLRFMRLGLLRSNPPWKLPLLLLDDLKRLWKGLKTRTNTIP